MEARQTLVDQLFDGSYKFIIPLINRNYEWGKNHTEQFLDDIKSTMIKLNDFETKGQFDLFKKYTYFIGSIVTYSDRGTKNLLLIDGQQRTTTICLILIVLRDLLKKKRFYSKDESLYDQVSDRLINKYDKTENRLKLKPINKDFEVYNTLVFETDSERFKNSNIYNNYKIIEKYLENSLLSLTYTSATLFLTLSTASHT